MIKNPESLIGRRYLSDIRIVAITPGRPDDGNRIVTIHLYGDRGQISLEELSALIESGILIEAPGQ